MQIVLRTKITAHYKTIANSFNLSLFEALRPRFPTVNVLRFDGCKQGDEVHIAIALFGKKIVWNALIVEHGEDNHRWYFIDEGTVLPYPLKNWRHQHNVYHIDETHAIIEDNIHFSTGWKLLDYLMYPILYWTFAQRKPIYQKFFQNNL